MEVGRILRLKEAIRGAMDALADKSATTGDALPDAYKRFREETLGAVGPEHREELERLCPTWTRESTAGDFRRGFDPIKAGAAAEEARALLGQLAGWLDGFVLEARMKLEAEAYAQEKLRAERGVGFRPSE